eukprot:TRINITY_DN1558_c0_g1_i1.p1 TRINITY_DN1558_c0_g1~~TRINITY_DN1558_c0_g1_i1.p1  ORF type:complete len:184 (+),score=44.02 TRINITY_DN1558_c0_g1_i1:156-707(+)
MSSPYKVRFNIITDAERKTPASFTIVVHPEWAPEGAKRFKDMLDSNFFAGVRFARTIPGFMSQFGIHPDPETAAEWRTRRIKDDPVLQSNTRGRMTFATSGPDSRTTQMFINFGDNSRLDDMGFSPFAEVVEGMDAVDSIFSGYGEGAPRGNGPNQGRQQQEGNAYLEKEFPKLSYIVKAEAI